MMIYLNFFNSLLNKKAVHAKRYLLPLANTKQIIIAKLAQIYIRLPLVNFKTHSIKRNHLSQHKTTVAEFYTFLKHSYHKKFSCALQNKLRYNN